ncbi:MAG: thioredoxin domain-containing protein [Planctomycetes bacterium]|nr:thioredoxin domain-containing protein [Planctomycetota bacterium]
MPDAVLEITDGTFRAATESGVALVEFYGAWCPPCKQLEPVMEKLARDYADRAVIAKLNVDEYGEAAVDNSIEDIPTIVVFKHGAEVERLFGAQGIETLAETLNRWLA